MINYNNITKGKIYKHNLNWLHIPDHPCRIFITGSSGSRKTNALLNLMKQQDDGYIIIDKIYLNARDPYDAKYQYLIKTSEKNGLEILQNSTAFNKYSNNMQDVYKILKSTNQAEYTMY